jgi:hypothetical protein
MSLRSTPVRIALMTLAALSPAVFFTGCASDRNSAVPASAIMRSEGNGDSVSATADPGGGTVYVYDATDQKMIYSGEIHSGQVVTVSSKDDNVTIDGRVVQQKGIHAGHKYRIFFDHKVHV